MKKEQLKRKLIDIRNGAMITPLLEELDDVEMLLEQKTLTRNEANKILTVFDGDLVQEEIERITE